MSQVDFVDDRRYATDCGPECDSKPESQSGPCQGTIWIYLIDTRVLWGSTPIAGSSVTAQCACCHRVELFRLDDRCETSPPTIGDIKRAHFATRIKVST